MMDPLDREDEEVRKRMKEIGHRVDALLPVGWFFVVLASNFGKDGRLNYISNANRGDVVRLMYEFIYRTKEQFGEHVADTEATDDERGARAQQRVAELEGEISQIKQSFADFAQRLRDPALTDQQLVEVVRGYFENQ